MFVGVGLFFIVVCSVCWRFMYRFIVVVVHGFRGLGRRSCFSIVRWMDVWISRKRCDVVAVGLLRCGSWASAACMSGSMSDLYLLYLLFVSVFVVLLFVREVLVWKMVQVGRWSVIRGGDGTSCDLHGSAGGECGVDECGGACGMVVACGCGDGCGETIVVEEVV